MADASLWQGRYKMSLDILLSQKARQCSHTNGDMSKRHRCYLEWTPTGQMWSNLSIKKSNDNGLTNQLTKEFHEPTVMLKKEGGGGMSTNTRTDRIR